MPAAELSRAAAVAQLTALHRPEVPRRGARLNEGEDGLEALDPHRHQAVAALAGDRLDLAELVDQRVISTSQRGSEQTNSTWNMGPMVPPRSDGARR